MVFINITRTLQSPQLLCQKKQAERFTDTIQFKHKSITNPTISPHDKIMQELANCKTALKGMMNENPNQQMEELQTLVNDAYTHLNQRKDINLQQVPRVNSRQVSRVDTNVPNQTPPRPSDNHTPHRLNDTPTTRQHSCYNNLSHLTVKINLPAATPAMSTRSKVRVANEHQCVTRLRQPTQSSLRKTRQANAVITKPNWQRILNKVEQDIERALAVMDHDSGKMMNYRQLRKHPKFNKAWTTSSANEFGRLASGVGGRVKGTKTIRFVHQDDVPKNGGKTSLTVASNAMYTPRK